MTLNLRSLGRSAAVLAVACSLLALSSAPAQASPDTLQRGLGNIIAGPLDMLLSPVVGGMVLVQNMKEIKDPTAVRVIFAVPGYVWLTGLGFGAGILRTVTGGLEAIPGVLLFPFETDLDPLMVIVERAPALIDIENPIRDIESPWVRYNPVLVPFCIPIRFGLNYTQSE